MTDNERIHRWLGLPEYHTEHHWRMPEGETVFKCTNCGKSRGLEGNYCRKVIPANYDTDPVAMVELLEAVRAKGHGIEVFARPDMWGCRISYRYADTVSYCHGDTAPAAVVEAVIALINAEEKL